MRRRKIKWSAIEAMADELLKGHPEYISPAQKAARTRETPYSPEALEAMMGSGCYNSAGYEINPGYAFEGGNSEAGIAGEIVPIAQATQEQEIDTMRQVLTATHRKGGDRRAQNRARRKRQNADKRKRILAGK